MSRRRRGSRRKKGGGKKTRGGSEAWQELARRRDGQLRADRRGKPTGVDLPYERLLVTVDTYVVSTGSATASYTRARLPFVALDEFTCKLFGANPFTRLAARLGIQDVRVGHGALDRQYVVQGSSEGRLRSLILGTRVGQLLIDGPTVRLEVKPLPRKQRKRVGDGIGHVLVQTGGKAEDVGELERLADLCIATFDQLERLGSAGQDEVRVNW